MSVLKKKDTFHRFISFYVCRLVKMAHSMEKNNSVIDDNNE